MKPEFHFDFPAGQQHTPRYFCLQGSSPGFSPPVSSGLFDDPTLADRRGTRMVGQNKDGCACPPQFFLTTRYFYDPFSQEVYLTCFKNLPLKS